MTKRGRSIDVADQRAASEAASEYVGEHQVLVVLETPDLALVICERRVAGMSPGGEQVRLDGQGCAVVRPQRDGAWRIAADAWQAGPELPAEGWLSRWPDAGTRVVPIK